MADEFGRSHIKGFLIGVVVVILLGLGVLYFRGAFETGSQGVPGDAKPVAPPVPY